METNKAVCDLTKSCLLCLGATSAEPNSNHTIQIFSERGQELKVVEILSKYFWFQPDEFKLGLPRSICHGCWQKVNNFHIFYQSVEGVHRNYFIAQATESQCDGNCSIAAVKKRENQERNSLENHDASYLPFLSESVCPEYAECPSNPSGKCAEVDIASLCDELDQFDPIDDIKYEITPDIIVDKIFDSENLLESNPCQIKRKKTLEPKKRDGIESDVEKNDADYENENNSVSRRMDEVELDSIQGIATEIFTEAEEEEEDKRIAQYFNMNCDFCEYVFISFTQARYHYREKHNIGKGYLRCCNRKFEHRGYVLEHIRWHLNPNIFTCSLCDKNFASRRKLKGHMLTHAPEESKIHVCGKCNKGFPRKHLLHTHTSRVHPTGEQNFVCKYCQKNFVLKSILRSHIMHVHERVHAHICDICAKTFVTKQALQSHRFTHTDTEQTRVQCNICGASLKNTICLERHIKRHSDGPQTCKYCDKVKPNRSALASHMINVHSKPIHQCTLCDKSFKKPLSLTEHMASHTGENLYTCPYCSSKFRSNSNMHTHRKISHPKLWAQDRGKKLTKCN